jgi:hypothetical protein
MEFFTGTKRFSLGGGMEFGRCKVDSPFQLYVSVLGDCDDCSTPLRYSHRGS